MRDHRQGEKYSSNKRENLQNEKQRITSQKKRFDNLKPEFLRFHSLLNHQEPSQELINLCTRVEELQKKVTQLQSQLRQKKKRIRRKAQQIDKKHECQFCFKRYGTLVSLNLHLKLKHRNKMRQASKLIPKQQSINQADIQNQDINIPMKKIQEQEK